ncbi:hypothetical protein [Bradyrhizobium barranii]|uniref:hypothetical protein n=1 Tax=Bradyrhizobium TaxID=374 RepID=UPI0024B280EB|nr:hypothetical protein [Bradyrhizobium barranii]WFT98684.1 hypothetical protein QA633_17435 [Bradyrhizobium barranii]
MKSGTGSLHPCAPCFIRTTGELHFSQRIRSGQLTVRAAYSGHDADVRRVPCYYANIPGRSVEPCIEVKTDDWSHHPHILRQSKAKHQESMITLTLGAGVQTRFDRRKHTPVDFNSRQFTAET